MPFDIITALDYSFVEQSQTSTMNGYYVMWCLTQKNQEHCGMMCFDDELHVEFNRYCEYE